MNKDYRRFTKTDWYAYAGAEQFKDGTDPFIYEQGLDNTNMVIIATAEGIELQFSVENSDQLYVWTKIQTMLPLEAEGELRALIKILKNFEEFPDLSYALNNHTQDTFKGFVANHIGF